MKALSVKEPWITMIVEGEKTIETRTWRTTHRGKLLLVGSKNPKGKYAGMAACVVDLLYITPMLPGHEGKACCGIYQGAQSWHLGNVRKIKPFPVKGKLGLYNIPDEKIEYIKVGEHNGN